MGFQIKKADSVTSILLFLFNGFLRAQGIQELPVKKILKLLEPFGKSETSIRMGLSRGVRNGLLVNSKRQGEVFYAITSAATDSFKHWWQVMQRFQNRAEMQRSAWDGQWTLVHVKEDTTAEFLTELKTLQFGNLSKNLYISPYNLTQQVFDLENKLSLNKLVFVFRSVLDNNLEPGKMVNEVWRTEPMNQRYQSFIAELNNTCGQVSSIDNLGQGLPILHQYGLRMFDIIEDDPQLPLELLPPGWEGIKAYFRFQEIRGQYLPGATQYVHEVISN